MLSRNNTEVVPLIYKKKLMSCFWTYLLVIRGSRAVAVVRRFTILNQRADESSYPTNSAIQYGNTRHSYMMPILCIVQGLQPMIRRDT